MFLTVTPNPALDKIIFIDEWTPGTPTQARAQVDSVGGKGLDASVALRHLQQETTALHFAAGQTGRDLLGIVERYGIVPEPIWVEGETRTAFIIAELRPHRHTHIFSGDLSVQQKHVGSFLSRYRELLPQARWVLTGGMLPPCVPPTFFRTLVEMAKATRVPVLVDAARTPLLECLSSRPDIIKMNRDEFGWTFDVEARDLEELERAARPLLTKWEMRSLVITCGADGILGFTPEGAWRVVPPPQLVVNAAGAGDVASATLAWRLAQGDNWIEALRWTTAASAASVLTEGTADVHIEEVARVLPKVVVEFRL